jgi:diguanylate cyclase (GGDEF)-like protein
MSHAAPLLEHLKFWGGRLGAPLLRPFSHLRIGARLTLAVLVLQIPIGVFGYAYVQGKLAAAQSERGKLDAIEYLVPLGQLMSHLAIHRGLTNIYLNGNASVAPGLDEVAGKIDQDYARLAAFKTPVGSSAEAGARLAQIRSEWTSLHTAKDRAESTAAPAVFARHTALIKQALALHAWVAETSGLNLDARSGSEFLVDAIVAQGVEAAEMLAQLRGQVAGLAQRRAEPAEIATVLFQVTAIESRFKDIEQSLRAEGGRALEVQSEIHPHMQEAEKRLAVFTQQVQHLSRGASTLSAVQLFASGTAVLDEYGKVRDAAIAIVKRRLDRTAARAERHALIAGTLAASMVALAFLAAMASLRSVIVPVRRLTALAERVAQGDDAARSGVDRSDEIGALARQFDRMLDERQRATEQLMSLALFDALTGLPNRRLLLDRIAQMLALTQRIGGHVAFVYIDLDEFKQVNDSYGHHAGDELLVQVARRLQDCIRNADTVARVGGDEFVAVLAGLVRASDAAPIAEKMMHALAEAFDVDAHPVHISASIGIAIYPQDGAEADELIRKADRAMYAAKERGRNHYRFWAPADAAVASSVKQGRLAAGPEPNPEPVADSGAARLRPGYLSRRNSLNTRRVRLLVGVIRAAHQRRAGRMRKAHRAGLDLEHLERLRRHVAQHGQVMIARREVLADRQHVDVVRAQVTHHVQDLVVGFAQAHHQAALGRHVGHAALELLQQLQRMRVVGAGARLLVQARHGL